MDCPLPPLGCGSAADHACTSHGGTRERHDFHRARTAAWETARLAAIPAAKLVAEAGPCIRHAKHAATLLADTGYPNEAAQLLQAISERNGHMSAKQAIALLVEQAEGGESQ
ncbi:hypothetical protein OG352_05365 [Streptomyces sp. NBC_01485]|uniref:hypothetical protein n=1 Tax=Streptomyces sp. NBC_01485 TaxID=2903884 RepID=UPI002E3003CC|nr:hypothetical protein [Streptomyces sp. NBC_01485]